jgi:predicted PurR-regulated permease PerM
MFLPIHSLPGLRHLCIMGDVSSTEQFDCDSILRKSPKLLTKDLLQNRTFGRLLLPLWILALALLVAFCYFASSLCIIVLLAVFLAIVVDPVITRFERWHVSRMVSSAVVIGATTILIGSMIYASYRQVSGAIDDLPEYARRVGEAIAPVTKGIQKVQDSAGRLNPEIPTKKVQEVKVRGDYPDWTTYVIRGVGPVSGVIIIVGVVPFLMFFLLIQKDRLKQKLCIVWGDEFDVSAFANSVTVMVRGFVMGNLIVGALMALVTMAVLYALSLQGAVLIGALSGFLNLVPFVGAILAAIVPMGASLLQYQPTRNLAIIFVTVIALHTISGYLLVPRLVGRRVSVSPVAATVGILFWGWLWGLIGVLLAVPLTAFVKIVADSHPSLEKIAKLLAERPSAVPAWPSTSLAQQEALRKAATSNRTNTGAPSPAFLKSLNPK